MIEQTHPENTTLEYATLYADLGYRIVPITPGTKAPTMLREWQKAATNNNELITNWYTGFYKNHGIGIVLGEHKNQYIFAVDVDMHGYDGYAELEKLEKQNTPLPHTITAVTGGGGRHYIYSSPVPIHNGRLAQGIDIKGVGGQILVEPTIHPQTGKQYEWLDGGHIFNINPTPAPQWLIDLVSKPEPVISELAQLAKQPTQPKTTNEALKPGEDWASQTTWAQILEADGWTQHSQMGEETLWTRPGKQTRDGQSATTNYKGTDLLKVFTTSHPYLEADKTYTKLGYLTTVHYQGDYNNAVRTLQQQGYGQQTNPLAKHDQWLDTIPQPQTINLTTNENEPDPQEPYLTKTSRKILFTQNFWNMDTTAQWAIKPIIPLGKTTTIAGAAGTGKSMLTLYMAASIATGTQFTQKTTPKKVLYIDYEMTPQDLLERLSTFGLDLDYDNELTQNLAYYQFPPLNPLNTPQGGQQLQQLITNENPDIIVIDTFSKIIQGDENSAETLLAFYQHVIAPIKRQNKTLIIIDHTGHDAKNKPKGSVAKINDIDCLWILEPQDNNTGFILNNKKRRQGWIDQKIRIDQHNTDWKQDYKINEFDLRGVPAGTKECKERIQQLLNNGTITTISNPVVKAALRQAGFSAKNDLIQEVVRQMKSEKI